MGISTIGAVGLVVGYESKIGEAKLDD